MLDSKFFIYNILGIIQPIAYNIVLIPKPFSLVDTAKQKNKIVKNTFSIDTPLF